MVLTGAVQKSWRGSGHTVGLLAFRGPDTATLHASKSCAKGLAVGYFRRLFVEDRGWSRDGL